MSVKQFKAELKKYVQEWCSDRSKSIDDPKSRGMAFEDFTLMVLASRYEYDGVSSEENIFRSNEGGFDIIIPPSGNSEHFTVCQCEMGGYGKKTNTTIDRDKSQNWFGRLTTLMDPGWVDAQKFPNDLKNLLKDLRKQIDDYKPVK